MTRLGPKSLLGGSGKRNLFSHVTNELGGRIVRGEFKPGEALPIEADLGQEFGASRSVIREAVKSLAAKGLLESKTRTGISVLPPERWSLFDVDVLEWRYVSMPHKAFFRELFEIRRMIEPEAAAFAAGRGTARQIAAIGAAFAEMEAADEGSDAAIGADLRFHRAILAAGHNALLLQMGNLIGVGLLVSYRISSETFTMFLGNHRSVLAAIKERNSQKARRAMDSLLVRTRDFLEAHTSRRKP